MNLIHRNHRRYLDDHHFLHLIGDAGICVPSDFLLNRDGIDTFWEEFYAHAVPRVVICGLNPGRLGASKTGIPFVDFQSLSQLVSGIQRSDAERSSSFFFKVVQSFGIERFFQSFYVTNVASVGFVRDGKNLNYPELPAAALSIVECNFLEEMKIIQPSHVISLGTEVQRTVKTLLTSDVDCSLRLPHPAWVTTYRGSELDQWVKKYVTTLKSIGTVANRAGDQPI
jgi:uracil-DNA glycosylase